MEHAVRFICVAINAVADSGMFYLQPDVYNISFKVKRKLHTASGSAPPPTKNLGAHLRV
jgi:hypothetical protein